MRTGMCCIFGLLLGLVVTGVEVQAQQVTNAEIQDVLKKAPLEKVTDKQLRVVSINGEYNIGIGILRRTKVSGNAAGQALEHSEVTEVYHILEGTGTLVTGGKIKNPKALSPDSETVKVLVGPSAEGGPVDGGVSQKVGPGDVIVVPANTPHWFSEIPSKEIVYLVIRVDPHKVLPAGYGAK